MEKSSPPRWTTGDRTPAHGEKPPRSLLLVYGPSLIESQKRTLPLDPTELSKVSETLTKGGIAAQSAEVLRVPKTFVKLDGDDARKAIKLVEALEELDDVQRVSANFDIPDEILQQG